MPILKVTDLVILSFTRRIHILPHHTEVIEYQPLIDHPLFRVSRIESMGNEFGAPLVIGPCLLSKADFDALATGLVRRMLEGG